VQQSFEANMVSGSGLLPIICWVVFVNKISGVIVGFVILNGPIVNRDKMTPWTPHGPWMMALMTPKGLEYCEETLVLCA